MAKSRLLPVSVALVSLSLAACGADEQSINDFLSDINTDTDTDTGDTTDDSTPDAACQNECEQANSECQGPDFVVCEMGSEGCFVEVVTECGAGEGCDPQAGCYVIGECPETDCTEVSATCDGDVISACIEDENGCLVRASNDCSETDEVCVVIGEIATCVAPDCAGIPDACAVAGLTCEGSVSVSCEQDANGCLVAIPNDCAEVDFVCDPATGSCVLPGECPEPAACELGTVTCDGDVLTTCAADELACAFEAEQNCADFGFVCADGACVDPCAGLDLCAAPVACDGTDAVVCTEDANGCLIETERTDCADQEFDCVAGRCVNPNCPGEAPCVVGEATCDENMLQTCDVDANGCPAVVELDCTATAQLCEAFAPGAAECVCEETCFPGFATCEGDVLVDCIEGDAVCPEAIRTDCAATGEACGDIDFGGATCVEDPCGDGIVDFATDECDDGNLESGDGCSATCDIEEGWACEFGEPSVCREIICGDSAVDFPETCDDGNDAAADGCDSACLREPGFVCDNAEPTVCRAIVCGDSLIDVGEGCDDGNAAPSDGCGADCTAEDGYFCVGVPSECVTSTCGDGELSPIETCDDGNAAPNDGCTAACAVELSETGDRTFAGELTAGGPTFTRPSATCVPATTATANLYRPYAFTNLGDAAISIDVAALWNGPAEEGLTNFDGYLIAYADTFDPAAPGENCVTGNDDFEGTVGSRIAGLTVLPGQTIWIIAATYLQTSPGGTFELVVTTLGCGDGVVSPTEGCDDENSEAGDGCDACVVESGAVCFGEPSECIFTECGNGEIEIGEGCDDGNATPGDACSANCRLEMTGAGSINIEGSLENTDPRFVRPSAACVASSTETFFDSFVYENVSDSTFEVVVTASWLGTDVDGFLHVYDGVLEPGSPLNACLVGNDDFDGIDQSQVTFTLAPGDWFTLVASAYDPLAAIGDYTIVIETTVVP